MKKVKLFMILMCVLMCLSGCTINGDTVATITGNEAAKTKTTCTLERNDTLIIVEMNHDGEEINNKPFKGRIYYLNYRIPQYGEQEIYDNAIILAEKQNPLDKEIAGQIEFDSLNKYPGELVASRTLKMGNLYNFKDYKKTWDFFELTSELRNKEVVTYQDFEEHFVNIGYTCK